MSKIAGILLILVGALTAFLGWKDITQPSPLTPYAAWSSIGLGTLMILVGIAHFRAPHKSFLISVPLLITFVIQVYCFGLFYDVKNLWVFVAGHAFAAAVILIFSYLGYKRVQAAG